MLNKSKIQQVVAEMEAALEEVAKKHGLTARRGNVRFTSDNFNVKFDVARVTEGGDAVTPEMTALKLYHPNLVGKTFNDRGEKIQFVGYNRSAHKYPLLFKNLSNGKVYKTNTVHAQQLLKLAA